MMKDELKLEWSVTFEIGSLNQAKATRIRWSNSHGKEKIYQNILSFFFFSFFLRQGGWVGIISLVFEGGAIKWSHINLVLKSNSSHYLLKDTTRTRV